MENEQQNKILTNTLLVYSKKNRVRCTKTLVSKDNKVCFVKDHEYDVIEATPILLVINRMEQKHLITREWLNFFYFC